MTSDEQGAPAWVPQRQHWITVGAITLLALVLRVLAARGGLWLDEAWSASFARQSATPLGLILNVHHDNNHLLNTLWLQLVGFGAPPMVQRGLAIVTGTLMVPVAAWVAKRWGAGAMAMTALLFAVSPIMVTYGSEVRGYAPMMLALLGAIGLVLNWLEDEGAAAPRRQLAWAFAVGTLAQLTMVFGLAALIGTAWITLVRSEGWRRASTISFGAFWPAIAATIGVFALVFLPAMLSPDGFQVGSYTAFAWADWARAIGDVARFTTGWARMGWPWSLALCAGISAILLWRLWREPLGAMLALSLLGLPLMVALLHIGNAGYPRYYLLSSVVLLLALGAAAGMTQREGRYRVIALVVSLVMPSLNTLDPLINHSRGDPLKAVALIPHGVTTLWTPEARDTAVIESAAAASHRTLTPVTARCPAAHYAFIEAGLGEPPASLPPPCPGARYVMAGQGETYGLSGADWWLYRRVR